MSYNWVENHVESLAESSRTEFSNLAQLTCVPITSPSIQIDNRRFPLREDRVFIKISKESFEMKKIDGKKRERERDGDFVEYINSISDILRPVMSYLSIE